MTMEATLEAPVTTTLPAPLVRAWRDRAVIPYLGPGVLALCEGATVPGTSAALVAMLTARASVPHKVRSRLTQAAQYIENFKHRRTLVGLVNEAFAGVAPPSPLHRELAALSPPAIVDTWYDGAMRAALAQALPPAAWGEVQGLSQSEHFGTWTRAYASDGSPRDVPDRAWDTLLYKPLGSVVPAGNYLVSDSDFVEVLTEIDIQTPIPEEIQRRRTGTPFLFLGCRFDDQLARSFARQVAKRSAARHWALLPDPPTRMEARFLVEQNIERIALSPAEFVGVLRDAAVAFA
jgi:hypothetical protein